MADDAEPKGTTAPEAAPQPDMPEQATIEQARKFLQDDKVRLASRETKVEFLQSKGLQEPQITALLDEELQRAAAAEVGFTPSPHPPPEKHCRRIFG